MSGPGQAFSVGSDTTLTIISNGAPVAATILTSFEPKQVTTQVKSKAITGVTNARDLEEGWDLDIEWDRGDSTIDDYFAAKEAARYAGQQPPVIFISETIKEPDGVTISRYRYGPCTLKYDSAGKRAGDAKIEPKASGFASRRIKVS